VVRRLEWPAILVVVELRLRESTMIGCPWRKRSARNEEIQCEVIGVEKREKVKELSGMLDTTNYRKVD
jgi:hypothetical protein